MLTIVIPFRDRSLEVLQCCIQSQTLTDFSRVVVVDFGSLDPDAACQAVHDVFGLYIRCETRQYWNIGLAMNIGVRKLLDEGMLGMEDWVGFSGSEMMLSLSTMQEVIRLCDDGVPSLVPMRDAPHEFGEPSLDELPSWLDKLEKWHCENPISEAWMLNRGTGRLNMQVRMFVGLGGMHQTDPESETTPMREDVDMYARMKVWQTNWAQPPVAVTRTGFHVWHPPRKEMHEASRAHELAGRIAMAEKGQFVIGDSNWGRVDFPVRIV